MRLTLRTLLAFLDDILEPADAHELGQKIKESTYASGLVHRIRGSMGRLRLTSPRVLGKGMGADANTVSEYLDNTLPVDRVPEFEKVCLESDMNLAEVASCHQILTLVLGEPAEVDESLRHRMYGIGGEAPVLPSSLETLAGHVDGGGSNGQKAAAGHYRRVDQAVTVAEQSGDAAPSTIVSLLPEKERSSTFSKYLPFVLTPLIVFVISTILLVAFGRNFGGADQVAENPSLGEADLALPEQPPQTLPPVEAADAAEGGQAGPSNVATDNAEMAVPTGLPRPQPMGSDVRQLGPQPPVAAADVLPRPAQVEPPPLLAATADGDSLSLGPENNTTDGTGTSEALPGAASEVLPGAGNGPSSTPLANGERERGDAFPDGARSTPVAAISDEIESELAAATARSAATPPANEPPPQVEIGRNNREDQVLAVWDVDNGAWMRMPAPSTLKPGQRIRSLPLFRPQLLLTNGIQVTLVENVDVSLGEPLENATPVFHWVTGQAIFSGTGQVPGSIVFVCGPRQFVIEQQDAQSDYALEVETRCSAGDDPATAARHVVIRIWSVSGGIRVSEEDEQQRDVGAGEEWTAIDRRPARISATTALPEWVTNQRLRELDAKAVAQLEPTLTSNRSLTLALLEANRNPKRRSDIPAVSARCLAALNYFEPLIEAFSDREQRPHWSDHFAQLTMSVNRDAESSQRIQEVLTREAGEVADQAYRMLWGYTPEQLQEYGALDLVQSLESESLLIRVLAIETLRSITGKQLFFRPEQPLVQRRTATRDWQRRLEAGDVLYKVPPLVFIDPE